MQAEQRAAELQKLRRDMDALTNGIRDADARMRELEDAHGPLDYKVEYKGSRMKRGPLKLRSKPKSNSCHSYRSRQNKTTRYAQKSTKSSGLTRGEELEERLGPK